MNTSLATVISQISEPMVIVALLVIAAAWHAGITGMSFVWFVAYIFVIFFLIWIARLRSVKSLHTNWDISDRAKRVKVLVSLLGVSAVLFVSFFLWHNSELMRICLGLFLWLIGFFLITLKTKISGHMGILTLFIGACTLWFGIPWVLFAGILPFVAWSRLVLKRHTRIEVIGGVGYSILMVLLFTVLSVW